MQGITNGLNFSLKDIFIAEYDVTTFDEINSAYAAGKTIVAKYGHPDLVGSTIEEMTFYICTDRQYDGYGNTTTFAFIAPVDNGYSYFTMRSDPYSTQGVWSEIGTVTFASQNHADQTTTYGVGTGSNYGHLKLSDSTSSTSSTSGGTAATPSAVKAAYDLANSKDSFPSQTGNNGKFLTTNGSSTSWATVDALPSQTGNSGKVLTTNGSTASWSDAPTDVFIAEYGDVSYDDLLDAFNAGKLCYINDYGEFFPLIRVEPGPPGAVEKYSFTFFGYSTNTYNFVNYVLTFGGSEYVTYVNYADSDHQHGSLTSDGKIGSTADYAVYTTTNGAITAGSLATSDPTASGTSTSFIATASQDSKGKMTLTKASLPTASSSVAGITTVGASGGAAAYSHGDHIPSQTGNSGKFLTTNGSAASWANAPAQISKIYTGTCASNSSEATKVVTLDDATGFSLTTGVRIAVTFTFGIDGVTNITPKLNVNNTGNISIAISTSSGGQNIANSSEICWGDHDTVFFTYDGTYWKFEGSPLLQMSRASNSSYGQVKLSDSTSSTSSTSGGYAATPAAVKSVNDRLTYGSTDLTAGTSSLTTGVFYAYYT